MGMERGLLEEVREQEEESDAAEAEILVRAGYVSVRAAARGLPIKPAFHVILCIVPNAGQRWSEDK